MRRTPGAVGLGLIVGAGYAYPAIPATVVATGWGLYALLVGIVFGVGMYLYITDGGWGRSE